MRGLRKGLGGFAAALIALLMLSYASTQSQVMRTTMAMAVAPPTCHGAMVGMASGPVKAYAGVAHKGQLPAKSCPYCAAAAHLPVMGTALAWRTHSAFTFAGFRRVASHGPRGPPARQPRARGPPSDLLSV